MADDNPYDDTEADYNPPETAYTGLRPTGQVAPEPQPAYAGQNPNDRVDARPANYTGDQSTDTTQFSTAAIPSGGEADPLGEGEIFQAPPAAPAGRSVSSVAPIRSVTNSQGQTVPISTPNGDTALTPIPNNTKHVKGSDGTIYHAQPNENGEFTPLIGTVEGHADPQHPEQLIEHVPGHGNVVVGPNTKYLDAQTEKAQKKQETDSQKAAEAQLKQVEIGANNLAAQAQYGPQGTAESKQQITEITRQRAAEFADAGNDHTAAHQELASAKSDYESLVKKQSSNDSMTATRLLAQDEASRQREQYPEAPNRPKDLVLMPDGTPMPKRNPVERALLEKQVAEEQKTVADAKAKVDAAQKVADVARVQLNKARANQVNWAATSAALSAQVGQSENSLKLYKEQAANAYKAYKEANILVNHGGLPSAEAQPPVLPPPIDFGKYKNPPDKITPDVRQKAGVRLIDQKQSAQNPNWSAPVVDVRAEGSTAPEPQPMADPRAAYWASLDSKDLGTAYDVPGGIIKYADGQVRDAMGKPVSDLVNSTEPKFYLKPDAAGQYHSLSLLSGHPYDGVPEYQAPLPSHIEAMGKAGVDTADTSAVQATWEKNHWGHAKEADFLDKWQGANDDERQDLIAQTNPEQAALEKGHRELDTRALYRSGQISLQQARHLDFQTKGRAPGMQDPGDSYNDFAKGEAPTAKYLQSFAADTGLNPISLNLKAKATAAAVSAWADDYFKRNGNSADFDPAAFAEARDSMYGRHMGGMERLTGGAEDMAEGLAGFIPSIPTTVLNFGLGLAKGAAKLALQKVGINPADVRDVANAYGADQVVDLVNEVGIHPHTEQERELMRQRTEQFGRNAYTFLSGRLNVDSAKDLLNLRGDYGSGRASAFWNGSDGAKIKDASDALFKLVDTDQITQAKVTDLAGKLNDAAIKKHGITNYDKTNKAGFDYNGRYDLTDARSPLVQMLAGYAETRDPAYKEMFKQALSTSAGEEETQKALTEYLASRGHIAATPVGSVLDWINRNTGNSLNYSDPRAFETLRTSAADTTQSLQMVGAGLGLEGLSALPGLVRLGRGAASPLVKATGHALTDSAKVAGGAAAIEDILPAYTTQALAGAPGPIVSGLKQVATSAAHGGAFMGATALGSPGADVGDVLKATGEGMAIGAVLGVPNAIGKGRAATEGGRVAHFTDTWNERFPKNQIDANTASQAMRYVGADEPARVAAIQDTAQQIADIQGAIKAGTATPEQTAQLAGLRSDLDGHFVNQQVAVHNAVSAMQEINGVADPATRSMAHGLLKSRQGGTLTPEERKSVLRLVDNTATPDANGQFPSLAPEQADGSFVTTDAGLKVLNDAVPATARRYFPNSETEQLDAIKTREQQAAEAPPEMANPAPSSAEAPPQANRFQQMKDKAQAQRLAQVLETRPLDPMMNRKPVVPPPLAPGGKAVTIRHADPGTPDIHYVEQPGDTLASDEPQGHPPEFPHEAALHQHFQIPLTTPERVTLAKEKAAAKNKPQLPAEPADKLKQPPVPVPEGYGKAAPQPKPAATETPQRKLIRDQIGKQLEGTSLKGLVKVHDTEPAEMKAKAGAETNGGMHYLPASGEIHVSLPTIERQIDPSWTPEQTKARVRAMLDEEIKHHADEVALRNIHKRVAPDQDYGTWSKKYREDQWADDFSDEQKKAIATLYNGREGPGAFDGLKPAGKAVEGLRMLLQQREQGTQTELWSSPSKGLLTHLKEYVLALRDMLKGGKVKNPEMEAHLQAAEAILKESNYKGPDLDEKGGTDKAARDALMRMNTPPEEFHAHADALETTAAHMDVHHVQSLHDDAERLRQIAAEKEAAAPTNKIITPWEKAKPGDVYVHYADGSKDVIVARGLKRKMDAKAKAEDVGGHTSIDGKGWAVIKHVKPGGEYAHGVTDLAKASAAAKANAAKAVTPAKSEGGFAIPPQAGDNTGWKRTQDWRKAVDQVPDIEDKLDWLHAVANNRGAKATELDLSDALDKVEALRSETPKHGRIGSALWGIAQNPAASAETKARALTAREDLFSPGGWGDPDERAAKANAAKAPPEPVVRPATAGAQGEKIPAQPQSFDEFSAANGVSATPPQFPESHAKLGGVSKATDKKQAARVQKALAEWSAQRDTLRKTYDQKVADGSVTAPSRLENLQRTAQGEGPAAEAAQRLLAVRAKRDPDERAAKANATVPAIEAGASAQRAADTAGTTTPQEATKAALEAAGPRAVAVMRAAKAGESAKVKPTAADWVALKRQHDDLLHSTALDKDKQAEREKYRDARHSLLAREAASRSGPAIWADDQLATPTGRHMWNPATGKLEKLNDLSMGGYQRNVDSTFDKEIPTSGESGGNDAARELHAKVLGEREAANAETNRLKAEGEAKAKAAAAEAEKAADAKREERQRYLADVGNPKFTKAKFSRPEATNGNPDAPDSIHDVNQVGDWAVLKNRSGKFDVKHAPSKMGSDVFSNMSNADARDMAKQLAHASKGFTGDLPNDRAQLGKLAATVKAFKKGGAPEWWSKENPATPEPRPSAPASARVTPEQDKAYLDAVAQGDHATAQEILDNAARDHIRGLPKVKPGDEVDGLTVRDHIPNQSSISASVEDPEYMGLREFPMSMLATEPGRSKGLAAEIEESGEINPLIVVVSGHGDGPAYVLEGSHRIDALATLGKKSFPAQVIFDGSEFDVAKDKQGRVIPLSERFNPATPDIRYAAPASTPLPNAEGHQGVADAIKRHLGDDATPKDFHDYVTKNLPADRWPVTDYPERLHQMAFPDKGTDEGGTGNPPEPPAPPPEPAPADPAGIKKASVKARRELMGADPLEPPERQSNDVLHAKAQEAIDKNSDAGARLVSELARTKRTPEAWENALLAHETVKRIADVHEAVRKINTLRESADLARRQGNDAAAKSDDAARLDAHAELAEARARMDELEKVTDPSGTEQGRALQSRKLIAKNALDFHTMAADLQALQDGKPLTPEQLEGVAKRSEAMRAKAKAAEADAQAQTDAGTKRNVHQTNQETQAAVERKPRAVKTKAALSKQIHDTANDSLAKLMGLVEARNAAPEAPRYPSGMEPRNASPEGKSRTDLLVDVGKLHLDEGKTEITDWRAAMSKMLGDKISPHEFEDVYRRSVESLERDRKSLEAAATPAGVLAKAQAKGLPEAGEAVDPKLVRDMARAYIEGGHQITDEASSEALTAKIHNDLKKHYPDATLEDVRNAAGSYKEPEVRTRDDVERQASEYHTQSQQVAKLRDATAGKMPWRMGGWEKPSDEVRRLTKAVRDMISGNDLVPDAKEKQMANAQERTRTMLQNQIADMERQMEAGVRDLAPTANPAVYDDQMKAMAARVKTLKEQVAKLDTPDMHLPGALFSEAAAKLVVAKEREQKIKDNLASGNIAPEVRGANVSEQVMPELKAVRKHIAELNVEVAKRRREAGMMDKQMFDRLGKSLEKKRATMKAQIASGDFSSAPKREPYSFKDDTFAQAAAASKEAFAKEVADWEKEKETARLANRTPYRKWADRVVHISREFKLANLISAGEKLGGAGIETGLTKPVFDAVAQTMRLSDTLNDVRQKAIYEGSMSYKANVAGLERMVGQWRAVFDKLRTGKSSLDWAQKNPRIDGEMRSWMGQVHGAIKEPVRQFIYGKSMELRYAEAAKRGIDLGTDKIAAEAANAGAFGDAMTDIFMGDNLLTGGVRRMIGSMRGDKESPGAGNALADVLETLMPIINVPTNLAIRGARLHPLIGLPEAAIRIVAAKGRGELANHAAKLTPAEAEAITRAFKYGLGGLALSAFAWANPRMFGGIYTSTGDKPRNGVGRNFADPELEPGDVRLPGNWGTINHLFAHGPVGTWLNYVADARRMYEINKIKYPNHPASNLIGPAAFTLLAPVSKLPFVSALAQFSNPYKTSEQTAGELTTSTLAAAPKMAAKAQDTRRDGTTIRRNPKTFGDELKMAVPNIPGTKWPGLRQQVPTSKRQPPPAKTHASASTSAFAALRARSMA